MINSSSQEQPRLDSIRLDGSGTARARARQMQTERENKARNSLSLAERLAALKADSTAGASESMGSGMGPDRSGDGDEEVIRIFENQALGFTFKAQDDQTIVVAEVSRQQRFLASVKLP